MSLVTDMLCRVRQGWLTTIAAFGLIGALLAGIQAQFLSSIIQSPSTLGSPRGIVMQDVLHILGYSSLFLNLSAVITATLGQDTLCDIPWRAAQKHGRGEFHQTNALIRTEAELLIVHGGNSSLRWGFNWTFLFLASGILTAMGQVRSS